MRKTVKASKKFAFVWDEELHNACAFDAFLFNDPAHLALQPCPHRYSYYLIKKHDEVIHARCTFFIDNNKAYSPYRGSFGSIEFSEKIFFELLEEYWDYIEEDLRKRGVIEIFIKNYPVCYNPPNAQMLSFLYTSKGFQIKTQELNFHIDVDGEDFERKLHENERKKLNKCLKKDYDFKKETELDISKIYSFIKSSRERKNYPTTLAEEDLLLLLTLFNGRFEVYSLYDGNVLIALAVVVKVNAEVLYTFYAADNFEYRKNSPLVLIHQYLFKLALISSVNVLDLGIASFEGITNKGLTRFKEKLGGKCSVKNYFSKYLVRT